MTNLNESLLSDSLSSVMMRYSESFSAKTYGTENNDYDPLMSAFGITPELKRQNRQYWGRELGMCWQLLVVELCKHSYEKFSPALKYGGDEPCDLCLDRHAIDTKYRIGSGDSGTLKKFKANGKMLREEGFTPVLLIVRTDNLPAAVTACRSGSWVIYQGGTAFSYLQKKTGFDLCAWLETEAKKETFHIKR